MLRTSERVVEDGDGFCQSNGSRVLGVADGVGDGHFARHLMRQVDDVCMKPNYRAADAKLLLSTAHSKVKDAMGRRKPQKGAKPGGGAVAVVALNRDEDRTMSVANVGDCGVMVLRGGAVVYRTVDQQRAFNFPVRLSADGGTTVQQAADARDVRIEPADVVVLASDGVWDNVDDDSVAELVADACTSAGGGVGSCEAAARAVAERARSMSMRGDVSLPVTRSAEVVNVHWPRGRPDSVTVVVGRIAAADEAVQPPGCALIAEFERSTPVCGRPQGRRKECACVGRSGLTSSKNRCADVTRSNLRSVANDACLLCNGTAAVTIVLPPQNNESWSA
jgi:serine/threonine protein phosphatase PrpC